MAVCSYCLMSDQEPDETHAEDCPKRPHDVPALLDTMKRSGHVSFSDAFGKKTCEVTVSGPPEFVAEVITWAATAFKEQEEK